MAFQPVTAEEAHRLYQTGLLWVRSHRHTPWEVFVTPPGIVYALEDIERAYNIGDGYCCALLLED